MSDAMENAAWAFFALLLTAILAWSWWFVARFADRLETETLTKITASFALFLVPLSTFLMPVDIYLAASTHNDDGKLDISNGELESRQDAVNYIYYALYGMALIMMTLAIPFAYFYYEENDAGVTNSQRIKAALKYAMFILIFVIILLVVGGVIHDKDAPAADRSWVSEIYSGENVVEGAISFTVSIFAIIGYVCLIGYTALGMNLLGMLFIRRKLDASDIPALRSALEVNRERQRVITDKYQYSAERRQTADDKLKYTNLQKEERALLHRMELAERGASRNDCIRMCSPLFTLFGIMIFGINMLVITSLTISTFDRMFNSICGAECGFILDKSTITNPLDVLFVSASKYFPLDYILLGLLDIYFFASTFVALSSIGVRFFWVQLYKVRPGKTTPQGLLLCTVTLCLAMLSSNLLFVSMTPQYATFGSQYFNNGSKVECSIEAESDCVMSQMSQFVNRILLKSSFFAVVFLGANFAFAIWNILSFVGMLCCKSRQSGVDEDSDEETTDLLEIQQKPSYTSSATAQRLRDKYMRA
eukprot:TRINITY_DN6677_c0_g2_i4.p1 TRINITY_DN6677_c0_g2~~TRINITY_DN6677_c0_g2_i4.p1  ORF type:complete len:534 (+),score=112.34 TRINITY_DN6677_c0_g2_i4:66-1667(+)